MADPVQPYLTPQQQQDLEDRLSNISAQRNVIARDAAQRAVDTLYQQQQVERGRVKDTANAVDSAISRGLFRSSIQDADVFDITATAKLRAQYLQDTLKAFQDWSASESQRLSSLESTTRAQFQAMAVENARAIDPVVDTPASPSSSSGTAATPATNPSTTAPKPPSAQTGAQHFGDLAGQDRFGNPYYDPAKLQYGDLAGMDRRGGPPYREEYGTDSKGNPGVWHIYPDGHKVFVRK